MCTDACRISAVLASLSYSLYTNLLTVPPAITMDPKALMQLVTTEANMTCCASGAPRPRIQWYKDLSLVDELFSESIGPGLYDICNTLALSNLSISDIATYHCHATNTLAETLSAMSAGAELTVLCELKLYF